MRRADSNKGHLWSSTSPNLCTWFVRKLLSDTMPKAQVVQSQIHEYCHIWWLSRTGGKGAMVYIDVLFPNSRTGPKKTTCNRMAEVLRNVYLPLISSCRLNFFFLTITTCRIAAVSCWFLGTKNRVPSAGSQSAPCSERNGNEQVLLRERGLSLPFPFRQCSMLIYHKFSCPDVN